MKLPARSATCPSAQRLEAYFARESMPEVEAHLPSCGACAAYVKSLEDERAAFAVQFPTDALLARRPQASAPKRVWWPWALVGVAASLAMVFAVTRVKEDDVHLKGSAFSVVVLSPGETQPRAVVHGERLAAGDSLRFRYEAPAAGQLVVLDLDATGPSVLVPVGASTPLSIEAGSVTLPGSIVLDAAVGPEWLVAVYSETPFELAALLEQLRRQRSTDSSITLSCGPCRVETLRFVKGP